MGTTAWAGGETILIGCVERCRSGGSTPLRLTIFIGIAKAEDPSMPTTSLQQLSPHPESAILPPDGRGSPSAAPTGRGADWIARLLGVQEVAGSNPVAPIYRTEDSAFLAPEVDFPGFERALDSLSPFYSVKP
jgi:hypothetical protein